MLKLIVFDCDGVMFDSRNTNKMYYNDLLAAFNHPPMNDEELTYVHMHNVTDSVTHIFRHYEFQDMSQVHTYRAEKDYSPYLQFMTMEPDLVEFLICTKPLYNLAISTNRTTTMRPLLEEFKLDGYFDKVVTAEDVSSPKPAPDALFDILSFFNCKPDETIYIGDSIIDRQHTSGANVELIAFRSKNIDAEYQVDSFMEILKLKPFLRNE